MISLAKPLDQARFQITPFASGLSFPTSMLELADGSILVAINNGSSLFSSTSAQLQRLADNDGNGIADGAATTLAANLPGLVTSIRRLDDIIVALSTKAGQEAITLLRTGASANSPISTIGSLRFSFPAGFEHTTYAIALRRSPFDHQGLEVFFNLGAKSNSLGTTERVGLQGDNANISLDPVLLEADSIHRIRLTPSTNGNSFTATVDLIARGLRNAAGMIFSPDGDLYLQDNGIDGNPREVSLSADELNRIRSQDIGQIIPNFGFPGVYTDYITGAIVSSDSKTTEPIISFTPLDGRRSEGLTELALAPPGFGDSFKTGVFASFIGMVGRGGINNHENPIVFADPSTGQYYHFIPNQQLGNPYGLASTSNSLYISDISSTGNLAANTKGVIYRISTSEPPPPADNPTINLSVSPELAREDDGANLIFTFKRIGNTAGQLEVKYTVGGTASVQTDYSGIGDTSATRTVLFEEGSDTAVLAINPVADADFESDETVILTLIASPNYNIGATSSVKGTIQNDDRKTGTVTAITDNVGTIQGPIAEGAFSNDTTPTLSGSLSAALAAGESLSIFRNGSLAGYARVSGTSWSFTPSSAIAASGLQSFSAAVVDRAGNVGALSPSRSFVLDTSAPTQAVSISAVIDDTDPQPGSVAAGGHTNDTTPTLSGLLSAPLAAGESLWIYNGSSFLSEAVVASGALSWTATPNLSQNGSYALNARVVDAAGNLGRASANRSLILDTIAPQQSATITAITDNVGTIQGPIDEGAFSNDSTPTLSGSLSAPLASGERLSIFRNGSLAGYARVSGTSWSFTPSSAIAASGLQSFSAAVVDSAGNVGASSPARSFLLDSNAETTWSYDWGSASPLGTTPGILLARVSLPSPRSGEPNLKLTALRVDLTTPGLRLTATGPSADWQANTRETVTSTTRGFVSTSRQEGTPVVAAINTAFFTLTNGSQAVPTNLKGLAVRDGVLVSPAENGFSALLVDPITGARIEQISSTSVVDPTSLQLAVSGGQFAEGVVLRDGIPSGDSLTQNARSALGLSQDRRYLTMLTVDRELRDLTPSYYGATLRDVGTILAGMGSHTGMNLDGGGSTQMAWWNPTSGSSELLNAPLGGVERFVGSNLGVTYQPIGAV